MVKYIEKFSMASERFILLSFYRDNMSYGSDIPDLMEIQAQMFISTINFYVEHQTCADILQYLNKFPANMRIIKKAYGGDTEHCLEAMQEKGNVFIDGNLYKLTGSGKIVLRFIQSIQ